MICKEKKKTKPPHVVCQPLLTPEEPDLCNNFISKEPDYIDSFCIHFPQHCVLGHVLFNSDPPGNMDSRKEVVQPSRKPRNVGQHKSKPKNPINRKKIN